MTAQTETHGMVLSIVEIAYLLSTENPEGVAARTLALVDAIRTPDYVEAGRVLLMERRASLVDPHEQAELDRAASDVLSALATAASLLTVYARGESGVVARWFVARTAAGVLLLRLADDGWFFVEFLSHDDLSRRLLELTREHLDDVVLQSVGDSVSGWGWDGGSSIATEDSEGTWSVGQLERDPVEGGAVQGSLAGYLSACLRAL